MTEAIAKDSRFFAPIYREISRRELRLLIDPESPHWIATDALGADLVRMVDGKTPFGALVARYARENDMDWAKAWLHGHSFLQDALGKGFLSRSPFVRASYPGRSEVLQPNRLIQFGLVFVFFDHH